MVKEHRLGERLRRSTLLAVKKDEYGDSWRKVDKKSQNYQACDLVLCESRLKPFSAERTLRLTRAVNGRFLRANGEHNSP